MKQRKNKETIHYFCGWCGIHFDKEWYYDADNVATTKDRHTRCPQCQNFIKQP